MNTGVDRLIKVVIVILNLMFEMEGTYGTKVVAYIETPTPDKDTEP